MKLYSVIFTHGFRNTAVYHLGQFFRAYTHAGVYPVHYQPDIACGIKENGQLKLLRQFLAL